MGHDHRKPFKHLLFCLLLPATCALAEEAPRQECLGRLTFDVPEDMQWATYSAEATYQITRGGGHEFTEHVNAGGDAGRYDHDRLVIYVSDIVDRAEFDAAANYQRGTAKSYQEELRKKLEIGKSVLDEALEAGYGAEVIARHKETIKALEEDIPLTRVYDHDLGIPDAYILGSEDIPVEALLWRNQRVYYFAFGQPNKHSSERIRNLLQRFQPRELYQVPKGPGVCFPYGFIADDGKTAYSFKNSLRFTRTPNVIFTLLNASPADPWDTKPTSGTYDTHYFPGYDRNGWKMSTLSQTMPLGKQSVRLDGWRLDPREGSGQQERAWFGLAHNSNPGAPLIAVQIRTFQQGTDGLQSLTPPPDDVLPRWEALSRTISLTLDGKTE